ncbi:uncharacterized protein LOC122507396 isoform X2 [Leptopilina heterotoma]|uniref:uncharacterized protein LOC122507396 isoform X2 n=1 Tax=Leptopilina heterotoma TaxID=63436 RepID=UPI001CAA0609|nr:uncharacterized protein LOC122507396 isoform X2 [Leptopilina heterotoma]
MIVTTLQMLSIIAGYFNLVTLYMRLCQARPGIRRWWVKPHIRHNLRELFGAYQTLFLYYIRSDHEEFYKMARMTPDQFDLLYNLIAHRLQKASLRRPLSKKLRLILTLNYLANGDSNRTTANFFRIGLSTTYRVVDEVCNIIWECLSSTYIGRKDAFDWKIVARGFKERWDFLNCLGAIDGKEIRIKKPPHSGTMFFNYKNFYSFKLLAACDAYYRFTWIDVGDYGSVSDVSAFNHTDFSIALENNEADLPQDAAIDGTNIVLPFCFIGDAIFPLKQYLMKPFDRNRGLNETEANFNYRLARARNSIEDSFGLITNKWTILKDRMDFSLKTSITIVQALKMVEDQTL